MGEIPEDVFANLKMGPRGIAWAPPAGELLASALTNESCPVERTVVGGMLPRHFLASDKRKK
jgi:hypothetical protein